MSRKIIATAVLLMLSSQAQSAVLYDESVSGDLGVVPGTYALALGSNQVLGSWPATPGADADLFNVSLTAGLKIDSISVSYDSLENGEEINTSLRFASANLFDDNFHMYSFGSSGHSASFMDTFGPETGTLDKTLAGSIWEFSLVVGTLFATTSWSVDIVTSAGSTPPPPSAVPLPAALWLFGSALVGLLGFGTRRKSA